MNSLPVRDRWGNLSKICRGCGLRMAIYAFPLGGTGGRGGKCRRCKSVDALAHYHSHKDLAARREAARLRYRTDAKFRASKLLSARRTWERSRMVIEDGP